MNEPESPSAKIARLETELQTALHDLHQLADASAELDAARAELAELNDAVRALRDTVPQLEALRAELARRGTPTLPDETLTLWRGGADAAIRGIGETSVSVVAQVLIAAIDEIERLNGSAARRAEQAAEDVDATAHAAAEFASERMAEVIATDLERLDSRELSPGAGALD